MKSTPTDLATLLNPDSPYCVSQINEARQSVEAIQDSTPEKVKELITIFSTFDNPDINSTIPEWHRRALQHLSKLLFPTLYPTRKNCSISEKDGRFIGHFTAIMEHAENSPQFQSHLTPKLQLAFKRFSESVKPLLPILIAEVMQKPPVESVAFFKGYTHANKNTFDDTDWLMGWTDASLLYIVVAFIPEVVVKMGSVPEFHELLCKGLGQSWDLDRTKKFCSRIGLSFRQKGRPRKNKGTP